MSKEEKKFFDSDEFKRLKKDWYKKLSDEGFDDIELPSGFVVPAFSHKTHKKDVNYEAQAEYYDQCLSYLHYGKFTKKMDKEVWELHCDGVTVRATAKKLGLSQSSVFRRIEKHRKRMKGVKQ